MRAIVDLRRGNVVKYNIQIKERGVPMKDMSAQKQVCSIGTGGEPAEAMRERSWEYGLPPYLQHDLDAYKEGLAEGPLCWTVCGESCTEASTSRRSTMARSHMNMPIICVRSFCGVNEVPDFTNCKRVPGRAYNGANGKKIAIEHQGEQYMLKFLLPVRERERSCPTRIAVSANTSPAPSSTWLGSPRRKPSWERMMWGKDEDRLRLQRFYRRRK